MQESEDIPMYTMELKPSERQRYSFELRFPMNIPRLLSSEKALKWAQTFERCPGALQSQVQALNEALEHFERCRNEYFEAVGVDRATEQYLQALTSNLFASRATYLQQRASASSALAGCWSAARRAQRVLRELEQADAQRLALNIRSKARRRALYRTLRRGIEWNGPHLEHAEYVISKANDLIVDLEARADWIVRRRAIDKAANDPRVLAQKTQHPLARRGLTHASGMPPG